MGLVAAQGRLEERVRVLEAKGAASSRNSSVAPSADTSISRQERRALASGRVRKSCGLSGGIAPGAQNCVLCPGAASM